MVYLVQGWHRIRVEYLFIRLHIEFVTHIKCLNYSSPLSTEIFLKRSESFSPTETSGLLLCFIKEKTDWCEEIFFSVYFFSKIWFEKYDCKRDMILWSEKMKIGDKSVTKWWLKAMVPRRHMILCFAFLMLLHFSPENCFMNKMISK